MSVITKSGIMMLLLFLIAQHSKGQLAIVNLQSGRFQPIEGSKPIYLMMKNGKKISRVKVTATDSLHIYSARDTIRTDSVKMLCFNTPPGSRKGMRVTGFLMVTTIAIATTGPFFIITAPVFYLPVLALTSGIARPYKLGKDSEFVWKKDPDPSKAKRQQWSREARPGYRFER